MTDLEHARSSPEDLLWTQLESLEAGMLGIEGSGQHMQPMAYHVDAAGKCLWFLTKDDTDLAKALQPDSAAHFVIISKDHDFYACMSGPIGQKHDTAILNALWTSTIAQLFADDKHDPSLMMIALELKDAAIWALSEDVSHHSLHIPAKPVQGEAQDLSVRNHVSFD